MDILIVDDSRMMRSIIQRAIRQSGYRSLTVCEAENGVQALEKLRTETLKLVLSDWNMPEMSGLDLLRQVRAAGSNVPFGFITSEVSSAMKELAANSGANFFICKPFTPEDIGDALLPILGGS